MSNFFVPCKGGAFGYRIGNMVGVGGFIARHPIPCVVDWGLCCGVLYPLFAACVGSIDCYGLLGLGTGDRRLFPLFSFPACRGWHVCDDMVNRGGEKRRKTAEIINAAAQYTGNYSMCLPKE